MYIHPRNKELVRKAKELGFEVRTTKKHLQFLKDGRVAATASSSASDWRSEKNVLAILERVAGQKTERVNKRKSRKNVRMAGFIETFTPESQVQWGKRIAHLIDEHRHLVLEFKILAVHPVTHDDINRAAAVIRRISEIETFLIELKQPVERLIPKK